MRILSTTLAVSALAALMGSSAALAADMSTPVVPYVAPTTYAPAPASNWDGVFIGIFGGAGMGEADHTSGPGTNDASLTGMLVGVSIGANAYLSDGIVGGVEADIAWSNITGTATAIGTSEHTIGWMGSLRGVLGYDAGAFMPYLTGGLAVANATRTSTLGGPGNTANATHFGYTVGGGVEVAATDNLVIDLQYRYSNFGSQEYDWSGGGINPTIALSTHTVSAGLKWQMD